MDRSVVCWREAPTRQGFLGPQRDAGGLELVEIGGVAQSEAVLEDGGADIAIPVRFRVVEVAQRFFPNCSATTRRRSSGEAPRRSRSAKVFFMRGDSDMPSTAAILAMGSRPSVRLSITWLLRP